MSEELRDALLARLDAERIRVEVAEKALIKYGAHLPDCHPGVPAFMGWPCRCGLDEARGKPHPCEQCRDSGITIGEIDPVTRKYLGPAPCPCRTPSPARTGGGG